MCLPLSKRKSESSCCIKLENNCLTSATTQTCCLMTSVYVANATETRAQHVGCSCGNKHRNAECFNTCQSKQRNFPNTLTTPRHTDMRKDKADPKINSAHKADCNYPLSNSVMKGPGLRLEVSSFWMNRAEQGFQFTCCKADTSFSHRTTIYLGTDL